MYLCSCYRTVVASAPCLVAHAVEASGSSGDDDFDVVLVVGAVVFSCKLGTSIAVLHFQALEDFDISVAP